MTLDRKILIKYRVAVTLLALVLVGALLSGSLFVYDYTEHDPKFCVNCHIMKDAFTSWETSIHKGIECHDCHYATVLERNQMLFKTFVEKPSKVSKRPHEKKIVPSTMCIKCHWEGKKEIKKISNSTGHAMHWFKGAIECTSCHALKLHQFEAEQKLCINCHEAGRVVLDKMKNMFCTECHSFRQGALVPKSKNCVECHALREPPQPDKRVLAHQQFDCMTCHSTHDAEHSARTACGNCHFLTMQRGKHPIHLQALDNDCLTCHKPHSWKITETDAKDLCQNCHKSYPLKNFRQ